jgi:hypothetical protein
MAKKNGEIESEGLENFNWDNEQTFFGIEGTAIEPNVIEVVTKTEEEDDEEKVISSPKKEVSSKEKVIEDDEDDDVPNTKTQFTTFTDTPDDEPKDDDEVEEVDFVSLIKKGDLFEHVEVKDDEELTVDRIKELIQENTDNQVEEMIEGFKEDAGEIGVAFFKHVTSGGDANDFLKLYREAAEIPAVDIATEEGQDEIIEFYLDNYEKLDKEDKKDRIAWFEESGKKKKYAEKYQAEIVVDYERRKQALADEMKENVKLQEQKRKEIADNLKEKLNTSEVIGSYRITKEDKKTLVDAIVKSTVKIGNNKYITPLQHKIGEIYKNPEKLIQLAKVVMSDFDTSDIETEAATKVVKKVKSKLLTSGKTVLASQPKTRVRSLSEFFE